ncbi:Uu.00g026960.m01.CDS01 [Anthostomella pinea]|uniref:ubiquitinyl hydrolase 1 n=1 Tax=Anthostomella pinea TaxID=933095 RepID=A0AAI8V7P3_9PEZI|nr:Uu.00g026960.m01.CDS01 [Anthostomella pinea]
MDKKAKAAVYIGTDNRAWVHFQEKNKVTAPLLATPFADNLTECVVYLDEAHTRGVDLKLPPQARSALTLACSQTKDSTMQAAMRLRQLGTTQSVTFFAPPEVDQSIREFFNPLLNEEIDSSHVVHWLLEQTCRTNEDLQGLYVAQGMDFCRCTDAAWRYRKVLTDEGQRASLLDVLRQPERQTLEQLYGAAPASSAASSISDPQLQAFAEQLRRHNGRAGGCQPGALEEVEQERELQVQVEQVRQSKKPVQYDAMPFPGLHPHILHFARSGVLVVRQSDTQGTQGPGAERALSSIAKTNVGKRFDIRETSSRLYASREFWNTIIQFEAVGKVADNFLRPVEWILWSPKHDTALVVIPEEAELLIPVIRGAGADSPVYLLAYAVPVTKSMMHFNDLKYYTVPELPDGYCFPEWLRIELGIFAGRLYVDIEEWAALSSYVRQPSAGISAARELTPSMGIAKFSDDPAAFLLEWLTLWRKTQDILHTPMGYICTGRALEEDHPFRDQTS